MPEIKYPPLEDSMNIVIEFNDIKFVVNRETIYIESIDSDSEKPCCIQTTFEELHEVVDVVGASVLAGVDEHD